MSTVTRVSGRRGQQSGPAPVTVESGSAPVAAPPAGNRLLRLVSGLSFVQLVLIGFLFVTVPLIVVLLTTTFKVDDVARLSQRAVFQSSRATQWSRQLVEQAGELERNARQYLAVEDPDYLEIYQTKRKDFFTTIRDLARLEVLAARRELLEEILNREERLSTLLDDPAAANADNEVPDLLSPARSVLYASSEGIAVEADELGRVAREVQYRMFWQTLAVVPASIVLLVLFTWLIVRPLRQVNHGIRQMGSGQFNTPVVVRGPRDLEELGKRLEWLRQRLNELEAQKVGFLRRISHDLKTPLASIREATELLQDRITGEMTPEQTEIVAILHDNAIRLQKLLEDLLKFSVSRTPLTGKPEPGVRLDDIVRRVLSDHRLFIANRGLSVDATLQAVALSGDRDQLRTIIDNLVSNAVKYTNEGGRVKVILSRQNDNCVLDIVDSGPGIDASERERIFEPFVHGRAVDREGIRSSGLGLAIVREFVHFHHGTVEVIDRAGGAHFRVVLPGAEADR